VEPPMHTLEGVITYDTPLRPRGNGPAK